MELSQLEDALHAVDTAVVLAPPWLLRQVIAFDRGLTAPGATVPHRACHCISRQRLTDITHQEELPFTLAGALAPMVRLLNRPDVDWLTATPAPQVLLTYWRLLFHTHVDGAITARLADSGQQQGAMEHRIDRLGRTLFSEARAVLHKERFVLSSADDQQVYTELAAVFLELYYFDRVALGHFFPSAQVDAVLQVLGEDVDAQAIWQGTRLPGAPTPSAWPAGGEEPVDCAAEAIRRRAETTPQKTPHPTLSPVYRGEGEICGVLLEQAPSVAPTPAAPGGAAIGAPLPRHLRQLARARRVGQSGNSVKAAILATRLVGVAADAQAEADANLQSLVRRLSAALEMDSDTASQWLAALGPLLARAAAGWWNAERRLLYDLQKVCIDHELGVYSVGVVEWVLALGRQPLRRPLPAQQVVLLCKHLRLATNRLSGLVLPEASRNRMERLLLQALDHTQSRLRQRLRPAIRDAVAANLHPGPAVEEVAQNKLVDELLDGVVRRDYSTMGDLRDTIWRNQLKCDDLSSAGEFFHGDQLLRIDRKLKQSLDGVYRGGEVYSRAFQRLSSLMFATPAGRFLTRFVIMPFGGAYICLAFLDHTVGALISKLGHGPVHMLRRESLLLTGLFALGLLNWPAMRSAAGWLAGRFFHLLGRLVIDLPCWLAARPLVQVLINGRVTRMLARYLLKPLVLVLLVDWMLPGHLEKHISAIILATVFLVVNMILNSRAGRLLEHMVVHTLVVLWTRFTGDILAGAFRLITAVFQGLLESLDRMLYAVDEWLRFRTGQRRLALVAKAALGVVWFFVTYVTRFVINLLVEPQINPIKHFPVVTVSHKIILPTAKLFATGFERLGLGAVEAGTAAGIVVFSIPGIFGFLAWELKSNWGLYKANRPRSLRPVLVGSHGESMARLLRPGLHSGTIPKIFTRLRKAHRRQGLRRWAAVRKQSLALAHVRHDVGHFFHRQFLATLNQHPVWQNSPVELGEIDLSTVRIDVTLRCPAAGGQERGQARVFFEQRSGWIVAGIDQPGWMVGLDQSRADLLSLALLGLYKMSAVDMVTQHLDYLLRGQRADFDLRPEQLFVWLAGRHDQRVAYDLGEPIAVPQPVENAKVVENMHWPTLEVQRLLLRHISVDWTDWVAAWQPNGAIPVSLLAKVRTLPAE